MIKDWVDLAVKHAKPLGIAGVITVAIGAPWTIANYQQEKSLHAAQLEHMRNATKFESEKENAARYITSLEAQVARLGGELNESRRLLGEALSDSISARNAANGRDRDLRKQVDGLVDQALQLAAKLDGMDDACAHFNAWRDLRALRARIASTAPLLDDQGQTYIDWLRRSDAYIDDGLMMPSGCST